MPGSIKGLIVYNSKGYCTLCFAKTMRGYGRPFTSLDLKNCLRGVYAEPGISRAKQNLASLAKNGYVKRIEADLWEITELGLDQIERSAMGYRAQKERYLGKRYASGASKKIANIAKSTDPDKLDEEEKLLMEVEDRMKNVKKKRSKARVDSRRRRGN